MPDDANHPVPFDRDSDVYRRLVAAVADGAVLFVGAGSSCRVGYPTWESLLARLSEAAKRANPARAAEVDRVQGINGLLQADTYRSVLGEAAYHDELRSAFRPQTPQHDGFHETLVKLPFRHVLTTNFDGVLQSAHTQICNKSAESFDLDEWDRLGKFRERHTDTNHCRQYVHVHGSIGRPQGIVLCKKDYDTRYINDNRAEFFLREVLTIHRVIFVGFSLTDEDLKHIQRAVAGGLGLSEPRHLALLPRPYSPDDERIERENLKRSLRIEPVYFDNSAKDYSSLATLVAALYDDVQAEQKKQAPQDSYLNIEAFLKDVLESQPELLNSAMQRLPELRERHAMPMALRNAGTGGVSDIDRAIDAVFKLVDKGLPDDAIKEYEAIRNKHVPTLTAKQRYRLDANIGNALHTKGDFAAAADAYLRAVGHYRESRDAQGFEVFAHFLRGDLAKAFQLAESLCQREPAFGRARSFWIRAHPDNAIFSEVEAEVPEDLRTDHEVALSLSDLASRTGDAAAHERYARAAVAASPDWPDALSMLGCAIVTSARSSASFNIDRGVLPKYPERIAEAEELFTRAIENTATSDPGNQLAGLHFNRSIARRLRGDPSGADSDLRNAFHRDPTQPTIVIAYAMESETPTDITSALNAVESFPPESPEWDQLQFVRALLLLRRKGTGDLDRAFVDVADLSRRLHEVTPPSLRTDVVRLGLRILSELDRASDGPAFVMGLPTDALRAHARAAFCGRAELSAANNEEAVAYARKAINLLGDDADWFDRREIALLAQNCRLHAEAVPIW